ncbi:hypothetical protein [Flavihumibacter fluvii]|uniref:hypothetical protein n=1 Tax=Flavihumibacter fluvii TaxID=2838157 RepID=UPI001BDF24E9|nr:hypothetical protein [Flavihumibacter fluvii]ULQ50626.1 hypothetical protein KJS93_11095 [Flavihumibacter fluvii]
MKLVLYIIANLAIAIPAVKAQQKAPLPSQTNEELAQYYRDLGHRRTNTGGLLAVGGGVAAIIGIVLYENSLSDDTVEGAVNNFLGGYFLMSAGSAATIVGITLIIRGAAYQKQARMVLESQPVHAYRLGAPTHMPAIGVRVNLGR